MNARWVMSGLVVIGMALGGVHATAQQDMRCTLQYLRGVTVPGGWLRYHIEVDNAGVSAQPAWLSIHLPEGTEINSFSQTDQYGENPTVMAAPARQGPVLMWRLNGISPGEARWYLMELAVEEGATPGTALGPYGMVGLDGDEATPADNVALSEGQTIHEPGPNLAVAKWHEWSDPMRRTHLQCIIEFRNPGDTVVTNVVITDTLPAGVMWDASWDTDFDTNRLDGVSFTPNVLQWRFSDMGPGEVGHLVFGVDLLSPGQRLQWFSNAVEIEPTPDINPADNSYTDVAFNGGDIDELHLTVGTDAGELWGYAIPEGQVTVTTDYHYVTTTAAVDTGFWEIGNLGPVNEGGTVVVQVVGGATSVVVEVPGTFTVDADPVNDVVQGQIQGWQNLPVVVNVGAWGSVEVESDSDGNYQADVGANMGYDLQQGDHGSVWIETMVSYSKVYLYREWSILETAPVIVDIACPSTDKVVLTWQGEAGGAYRVRRGTSCLAPWASWPIVTSGLAPRSPFTFFTDRVDRVRTHFYRIEQSGP